VCRNMVTIDETKKGKKEYGETDRNTGKKAE